MSYADPLVASQGELSCGAKNYYVIDQDGDKWKGPAEGVFNMDIAESLLSMCASGAQVLMLAAGAGSTLGFPLAPLIKYAVEEGPLAEADVCGEYTEETLGKLKDTFIRVNRGEKTYEEIHNEYGDLICTYRRTNIY